MRGAGFDESGKICNVVVNPDDDCVSHDSEAPY